MPSQEEMARKLAEAKRQGAIAEAAAKAKGKLIVPLPRVMLEELWKNFPTVVAVLQGNQLTLSAQLTAIADMVIAMNARNDMLFECLAGNTPLEAGVPSYEEMLSKVISDRIEKQEQLKAEREAEVAKKEQEFKDHEDRNAEKLAEKEANETAQQNPEDSGSDKEVAAK